jgi:2-oxo-4-hydroxy-4-carboxy-5-ureidoimidazoline decarboxylase
MTVDDPGLARLNTLPGDAAGGDVDSALHAALHACCAAAAWMTAIAAGRPYPDRATLLDRSSDVLAGLDWSAIRQALDAHPRIGERAAAAGREASWSAAEQSGVDSATAEVKAALVEANRAYEERFGHVFLIFATGRTDTEMLAAARQRVGNDEQTEQGVVRTELTRIVALRLTKLLDGV